MEFFFGDWNNKKKDVEVEAEPGIDDDSSESSGDSDAESDGSDDLTALHARFRSDLEKAPLDELREAARRASSLNAHEAAAGGWRFAASLAMMRSQEGPDTPGGSAPTSRHKAPPASTRIATGGWAPFYVDEAAAELERRRVDRESKRFSKYYDENEVEPGRDRPTVLEPLATEYAMHQNARRQRRFDSEISWGTLRVFRDDVDAPTKRWGVANSASDLNPDARINNQPIPASATVNFLDGSKIVVGVSSSARAHDIVIVTAQRLGVDSRHGGALSLYFAEAAPSERLAERILPSSSATAVVADGRDLVLAIRLFTEPLHEAAMRGLRSGMPSTDVSPAESIAERRSDGALARLLYAQTVAAIVLGAYPLLASARLPSAVLMEEARKEKKKLRRTRSSSSSSSSSRRLKPDEEQVVFDDNDEDEEDDEEDDEEEGDNTGSFVSTGEKAYASRLRLAALRLWSRAKDAAWRREETLEVAKRLVTKAGAEAFSAKPAPPTGALLAELEALLQRGSEGRGSLEIEEAPARSRGLRSAEVEDEDDDFPEAELVDLAARSPAHGTTLFAARLLGGGGAGCWVSVSRRGAALVSADGRFREADVPFECARRWDSQRTGGSLNLDFENPPNRWPAAAKRRGLEDDGDHTTDFRDEDEPDSPQATSPKSPVEEKRHPPPTNGTPQKDADGGGLFSGLSAYFSELSTTTSTRRSKPDGGEEEINGAPFSSGTPVKKTGVKTKLPSMQECLQAKRFSLTIDSERGGAGGSMEVAALLDDYALCDLAETPPRFTWETTANSATAEPNEAATTTLGGFYDALVLAVVRPPRFDYDVRLLGPSSFTFGGRRYHRHDVVLHNARKKRIHCSQWKLAPSCTTVEQQRKTPVVVFLHANSASRAQACHYLSLVLSLGCSLVAFDCAGSGLSDGDYVTLGLREAHDLKAVINWLRDRQEAPHIAVWGQSMGAAAALYYQGYQADCSGAARQAWPKLDAVVLDSPYSDFAQLATHIANERKAVFGGFTLPTMVLELLLSSLDASVNKRAGFSPLKDLSPLRHAAKCSTPALYVRARFDPLISQEHVESLARAYAGPRTLALVEGSHSSPRDGDARKFIARFLARHLPLPSRDERPERQAAERHLECAPWQRVAGRKIQPPGGDAPKPSQPPPPAAATPPSNSEARS